MPIQVSILKDQTKCEEVFALYRKDCATLGFMPEGAFEQAISSDRLLIAQDENRAILGYLFFRIAKGRAAIVHLCTSPQHRRKGVSRLLVTQLKKITAHLECITLRCRRDYEVNNLWPRYGFHPKGAIRGRGADGAELTIWHYDHGHQDLFSSLTSEKIKVAIDTNIFFDISFPDREHHQKAQGLTQGWVDELFELVVTPEMFNDIARCPDETQRTTSRSLLQQYTVLRAQPDDVSILASKLSNQWPDLASNEQGVSDLKHLAYCIVCQIRYFITRDEMVLSLAPELLQSHDLLVLSPVELISKHDAIEREREYQPRRLLGTRLSSSKLRAEQVEDLVETFRSGNAEKPHQLKSLLNELLADPRRNHVYLHQDGESPLAMLGHEFSEEGVRICVLRTSNHPLAPTVIRHALMELIRETAASQSSLITVAESYLSQEVAGALKELGFVLCDGRWLKPLRVGFHVAEVLDEQLRRQGIDSGNFSLDELGTLIWPAKHDFQEMPCYLIPIQAQWAEHFFDVDLASLRLPQISDIRTELHLGIEAVYYTASKNRFTAPGHILWYVSLGAENMGSMTVKATSRLRGVVRSSPKDLFKQFRRLGVYQWKQVYEAAHNDITRELTALKFSHTERFDRSISKQQLASLGIKGNLQGPMSVSFQTFKQIYQLGTTK